MPPENIKLRPMRIALLCLFVSVLFAPISRAQDVPIVELDHKESKRERKLASRYLLFMRTTQLIPLEKSEAG